MNDPREARNGPPDPGSPGPPTKEQDAQKDAQPPPDADALQEDIEHTREELAETVDLLKAKLDVKGRTKSRATDVQARTVRGVTTLTSRVGDQAESVAGRLTPLSLMGIVGSTIAGGLALAVVLGWRRRARHSGTTVQGPTRGLSRGHGHHVPRWSR